MADAKAPPGVRLRDPEDTDTLRSDIENGVHAAMRRYVHGYEYNGVRLELDDMNYADKARYSQAEQQEAQMSDRTLGRRLRGTVKLVDIATNEVLDRRKNVTLANVPYLTHRGTFIHNGSEYAPISQSRLLPGAYTRRRDNGELETHFNTRPGTGSAMRVTLDPSSGQYRLKIGTSDLHAYSVFKDLGVSDDELERRWGRQLLDINSAKYSKDAVDRAYLKAVPKWRRDPALPREAKIQELMDSLNRAQVAESILKQNLPNLFDREKSAQWRAAGAVMEKVASWQRGDTFAPDLTPDEMVDAWNDMNFDLLDACKQAAEFDPDLKPGDMKDSYASVYGHRGPRLASMRAWPKHWLDDQDTKGWLEWYENYAAGRRSATDAKQIARWLSFKRRQGALFVSNPTPRRAFALRNWAIDPLEMLPVSARDAFADEMELFRSKAFVKWLVRRHDFDDDTASDMVAKAVRRGAPQGSPATAAGLMQLAEDGFLKAEDMQR